MKTDIKENKDSYAIVVDLPGYDKDNIKIEVEDGYLTVHAATNNETEEKEEGKFVRKERYFGECSRSFYVGEAVETDDVKATFKNGILTLEIPKKKRRKNCLKRNTSKLKDNFKIRKKLNILSFFLIKYINNNKKML